VRYLTRPQLVSLISRAYLSCDRHLCNNAQPIRKQSGVRTQQFRQLIEDLFVKELRYRRLNLPARRRSWSKGGDKG